MRNCVFSWIASVYPTQWVSRNRVLRALWRLMFFTIKPDKPFKMRARYYSLYAHPKKKGTLTYKIIRAGDWEPKLGAAFRRYLTPGAFILDIGANFGHYSLIASPEIGPQGKIIAFEPNPASHVLLQENLSLLDHQNVQAETIGLSDQNATMQLAIDSDNPGGHSFASVNVRALGGVVEVPTYQLDQYMLDKQIDRKIDLIKIDVQGFEMRIFAGAAKTIDRDKPIVFCEVTPTLLANVGDSFRDILGFFQQRGYRLQTPILTGAALVSYEDLEAQLLAIGSRYIDVVFVPADVTAR